MVRSEPVRPNSSRASATFGKSVDQVTIWTVPMASLAAWLELKLQLTSSRGSVNPPVVPPEVSAPASPPRPPPSHALLLVFEPPLPELAVELVAAPPLAVCEGLDPLLLAVLDAVTVAFAVVVPLLGADPACGELLS